MMRCNRVSIIDAYIIDIEKQIRESANNKANKTDFPGEPCYYPINNTNNYEKWLEFHKIEEHPSHVIILEI